jgi:PAS domain S-box-containing protein
LERLEQLEHLYQTAPVGLALWDLDLRFLRINEWLAALNGPSVEDHLGRSLYEILPDLADQLAPFHQQVIQTGKPVLDREIMGSTPASPERRHYLCSYLPFRSKAGELIGVSTVVQDIDLRKRAELGLAERESALGQSREQLRRLAGRLISSQEDANARVARELHDDLTERLAGLALLLAELERPHEPLSSDVRARLGSVRSELAELSDDVHRLSRQLHPSIVSDAGLPSALRSECDALRLREGIRVELEIAGVPDRLPAPEALCLYRVAQEALRNVARHSGADSAELSLRMVHGELRLQIRDCGSGFDLASVTGPSLGLVSMEERVRLVEGTLAIRSGPDQGTEIEVRIPLIREAR